MLADSTVVSGLNRSSTQGRCSVNSNGLETPSALLTPSSMRLDERLSLNPRKAEEVARVDEEADYESQSRTVIHGLPPLLASLKRVFRSYYA